MINSSAAAPSYHGTLSIDVRFDRPSKTYSQGETVSGSVVVITKSEARFDLLTIDMEGTIRIQPSSSRGALRLIDSLSSSTVKSIVMTSWTSDIVARTTSIASGTFEYPFTFELVPGINRQLYETYHGVYLAIQYTIRCTMKRSFPQKALQKTQEFIVLYTKEQQEHVACSRPVAFTMTPESVQQHKTRDSMRSQQQLPKFAITGKLTSTSCLLAKPFTGEIIVHKCSTPIKSIEIQLIRAETCGSVTADHAVPEYTDVQTLQIADGDIARDLAIPIFMLFPRLFTCASTTAVNFKIDFELAIVIVFNNDQLIKEIFPITLHRW